MSAGRRRRPPKSMKVLGQRYTVTVLEGHIMANAADVYSIPETTGEVTLLGLCETDDCDITISGAQGADRMRETLLHETLHAIVGKSRLQNERLISGVLEETIIGRLAPILLDFIRDNKAVIAYLQEPAR